MTGQDDLKSSSQRRPTVPPDDLRRTLSIAGADDPGARHVSIVGGTYTILISGQDTNGQYCLIDMNVPPGGGPPPHRHDFEEMFTLLEGEIEFTFRGKESTVRAGSTVNIPANAPHAFRNNSNEAPPQTDEGYR
jgi:quercetin dioxygenase-like cupin family protein